MDTNNRNNPEYNNMYDIYGMNNREKVYSFNRYDNRRIENDRRFDNQRPFDNDRRNDNQIMFENDRRNDGRYNQYPYCDRNGNCGNPMWWLFWPFFFF